MNRTILMLTSLACLGAVGCDSQSTARWILTVAVNSDLPTAERLVSTTSPEPQATSSKPTLDPLVAALREFDQVHQQSKEPATENADQLAAILDTIEQAVSVFETDSGTSPALNSQVRQAFAVALDRAAETLPKHFAARRNAFVQAHPGEFSDHRTIEKQTINQLVTGYLVAPKVPADVSQVLALHTATFPRHAMNVELYTTIAERLASEGELSAGLQLARAGLQNCADHSEIGRLQDRIKQIYRKHPGEVGVPMNFAGATWRKDRFFLSDLKGKPALVVFWTPADPLSGDFLVRCGELSQKYSAAELEIVAVCLGVELDDLSALEKWHSDHGFPCHHIYSSVPGHAGFDNPIARFYRVTTMPEFFLLDHSGIVMAKGADQTHLIENELRRLAAPRFAVASP